MATVDPRPEGLQYSWSVMIPAYNSSGLLPATIESVLAQDPGDGAMEIVVIDDASTDGTADVVAEYAPRVRYWRQPLNVGAIANFNSCIARSRGEFVHILHADDLVRPGFYRRMQDIFADPAVGAALARCDYIDERGVRSITTRSERSPSGIWDEALSTLAVSCRVRPPAIAVRRAVYEAIGDFRLDLPHAADWEMWSRIAAHAPIWFEDQALAAYRVHGAQDTAGLMKTGANIHERVAAIELISSYLPPDQRSERKRRALAYSVLYASRSGLRLARRREWKPSARQFLEAGKCGVAGLRVR